MRAAIHLLAITSITIVALTAGFVRADFTFGEPVNLKTTIPVIDPVHESIDCFSSDGLEIYVESDRPGGQGNFDLWVFRRGSIDGDWGPAENLGPVVNTSQGENAASISGDGLTLYFHSNRPGGQGDSDIYVTTRVTKSTPWGPVLNLGPNVNSLAAEGCPWISSDGLELYFNSWRTGGYGGGDIYVTRRATTNDPWGTAENLGSVVNSPYEDAALALSPDELLLLFSDNFQASPTPRPGGYGGSDMWMAKRASVSSPWQAPVNLGPQVNSVLHELIARVSPDGSTLYFSTARSADFTTWENWQAPIIPIVDFNGDGKVDGKDILIMADCWGQDDRLCDIGPTPIGDGVIDIEDLKALAEYIGKDIEDPTFIAHWAFDEAQGSTAHDSVGGNDATVNGTALWHPESGNSGGALELNGVPNFATAKSVRNPSEGSLSVFAWVKGGAPGQVILSQMGGANWLKAASPDGTLTTDLKSAGRLAESLTSAAVITDGAWHRVGLVWDGFNRILYVDDVEVARDTQPSLASSTGKITIGAGSTMLPTSFWKGLIDDVRVYNRVVKP